MKKNNKRKKCSRGQALIELALCIPIFLLLLVAIWDLGTLLYVQFRLVTATREAVRLASESTIPPPPDVRANNVVNIGFARLQRVLTDSGLVWFDPRATVNPPVVRVVNVAGQNYAVLEARASYRPPLFFPNFLALLGLPPLPPTVTARCVAYWDMIT